MTSVGIAFFHGKNKNNTVLKFQAYNQDSPGCFLK